MDRYEQLELLTKDILQTYRKKNADYGNSFTKTYKEFGIIAPLVRMNDKLERVKSIVKKKGIEVEDESIRDTLLDLANYAMMTVAELDRSLVSVEDGRDITK